jgi:glycosyltransferase involved in cell wall biosynthesis
MKLAIVIEEVAHTGGQDRVIAELAGRLCRRHEVHLFCFSARDVPPEVVIHPLRFPLDRRPIMREIGIVSASRRAVDPAQFDFVMAQGGNCLQANCALVHLDLVERNRVVRETLWRDHPPGLIERQLRWAWYRRSAGLMCRQVRRLRGRCLAVSTALARTLAVNCGVAETDIIPVPNGVDHAEFGAHLRERHRAALRAEMGIAEGDFVALFVGGRWAEKGLPEVVAAFDRMQAPHAHLVVVGRGDAEAMLGLLPDAATRRRAHFLGPRDPVAPYYGLADCFVFPSHTEGFGLVALEAAASGLPLLMTPTGVGPELITEGETGYLLSHSAEDIAARLDQLALDPAGTRALGVAIRQRAQRYSWDRQAVQIEGLLSGWLRARTER